MENIRTEYAEMQEKSLENSISQSVLRSLDTFKSEKKEEFITSIIEKNQFTISTEIFDSLTIKEKVRKALKSILQFINQENTELAKDELHAILDDEENKLNKALERFEKRYINKLFHADSIERAQQDLMTKSWLFKKVDSYDEAKISQKLKFSSPFLRSIVSHGLDWEQVTIDKQVLKANHWNRVNQRNHQYSLEKEFILQQANDVLKVPMRIWHQLWFWIGHSTHKGFIRSLKEDDTSTLTNALSKLKIVKATAEPLRIPWIKDTWNIEYITHSPFNWKILVYRKWREFAWKWKETLVKSFVWIYDSIFDLIRSQEYIIKNNKKKTAIIQKILTTLQNKKYPSYDDLEEILTPAISWENQFIDEIRDDSLPKYKNYTNKGHMQSTQSKIQRLLWELITQYNWITWSTQQSLDALITYESKQFANWKEKYTYLRDKIPNRSNEFFSLIPYLDTHTPKSKVKPYSLFQEQFEELKKSVSVDWNITKKYLLKEKFDILISLHSLYYRVEKIYDTLKRGEISEAKNLISLLSKNTIWYIESTYSDVNIQSFEKIKEQTRVLVNEYQNPIIYKGNLWLVLSESNTLKESITNCYKELLSHWKTTSNSPY